MQKNTPSFVPELLAPAGSKDALIAAVSAGADAVYLGGTQFGARHYASNFDKKAILEAVNYCHLAGVRVYVTVNITVHDSELLEVLDYLVYLYSIGVDAVLIQDVGVLKLATEIVPELSVHASTQMSVHNQAGAVWAAEKGCTRVVPAREADSDEIREIVSTPELKDTGVEVFAHGALCYAYSGQCLFSAVIGGRSGNRGMCAQPCRKRYQLVVADTDAYKRPDHTNTIKTSDQYLLSTSDLCVYPVLDQICDLHVSCLKIEGRMRSAQYVGNVVSVYRKALDAVANGSFVPLKSDIETLTLAYSRGFTKGYISDESYESVMARAFSGNRGIYLGDVVGNKRQGAVVKLLSDTVPLKGDGFVCISGKEEIGLVLKSEPKISKGEVILPFSGVCKKGGKVYITSRKSVSKTAEDLLKHPYRRTEGAIKLNCLLSIDKSGEVRVSGNVTDLFGHVSEFSYSSVHKLEAAIKQPLTKERITESLLKTGGTPFSIVSCEIEYEGGLFAPVKILNSVRRELLEKAEQEVLSLSLPDEKSLEKAVKAAEQFKQEISTEPPENSDSALLIGVVADSHETALAAAVAGADTVFYEAPFYGGEQSVINDLTSFSEVCSKASSVPVWKLPRITDTKFLKQAVPVIAKAYEAGIKQVMVESIGLCELVHKQVPDMEVSGYIGLNVCNHLSVKQFSDCFDLLTLSVELSGEQIRELVAGVKESGCKTKTAFMVQGSVEAAVTKDNLFSLLSRDKKKSKAIPEFVGIKDEKNRIFPIKVDAFGKTHIFNAVENSLIDYVKELSRFGVDVIIIDARNRSANYAQEMTEIYKEAVSGGRSIRDLKARIKKRSVGGITVGGYERGL